VFWEAVLFRTGKWFIYLDFTAIFLWKTNSPSLWNPRKAVQFYGCRSAGKRVVKAKFYDRIWN
jgi:hypothetical protein